MTARAFLDTNVLVYAVDENEPRKREAARVLLGSAGSRQFVLSPQILGEFYTAVTRKLARPIAQERAGTLIDQLSLLAIVPIDAATVKAAVRISRSSQLSFWDSLVVAAADAAACEILLTEDLNDGQQIGSVRVENPFRERAV